VRERIRAFLFPFLVFSIIGSVWVIGWSQELEDETHGLPASPSAKLPEQVDAPADAVAATPVEP
jgi:hypothetical protein